jgi:23S rRNA (adenine2503-C2)-methyltransferase
MPPQTELLSLSGQELRDIVENLGQPAYRGRQLADAIFRQRRESLDSAPNLPAALKSRLAEQGLRVGVPKIEKKFVSIDGTVRYLLAFADGQSVETVWMPEGDLGEAGDGSEAGMEESEALQGENLSPQRTLRRTEERRAFVRGGIGNSDKNRELRSGREKHRKLIPSVPSVSSVVKKNRSRATICISSQVGCAVNCQFCLTALLGQKRNLSPGEIVGQVLVVLSDHEVDLERERMNLVFMGQGEPFLNYENFIKAVRLLVEEVGFPESRMTVSTSGIVPRIGDLGSEAIRPKLAISLNAPNDEIRERIMPINRKWNIEALLEAARAFPLRPRERLTFEYVLLGGVNDAVEHAREVALRVRDIRCKVNLIAWNPGPDVPFSMPNEETVLSFQRTLIEAGVQAFIRRPRGRDIFAACGQLKRTVS